MASGQNVMTLYRRKNLTQITSGAVSTIPKVAYIALGTGGVDEGGQIITPSEEQTELKAEVGRYPIEAVEYPVETTARYTIIVPVGDLDGAAISEMGIIDEAGGLCSIRACSPKIKNYDEEMAFVFDDEF